MMRLGLPVEVDLDDNDAGRTLMDRAMAKSAADIQVMYQSIGEGVPEYMEESRGWYFEPDENGYQHIGPTFVCDTDDDVFNVTPWNPSFGTLGFKQPDGTLLKDGEKIWIRDAETNEPRLLWADGQNANYSQAKARLDTWRRILQTSDLVTCSTPNVQKYVLREAPEAKTYIFPNCIDFTEYPKIDLIRDDSKVKILWQGSTAHWEDLWHLREPLKRIFDKYPQAEMVVWGGQEWLGGLLPRDRMTFIPWTPYQAFKMRLSTIGHHINLAPLPPTTFNQSRSGIKFYESSAIWYPAATLAETTGEYPGVIQEDVTGKLFTSLEEFESKLSEMIESPEKCREMAANAKQWVREERDPTTHVLKLHEQYVAAREVSESKPKPKKPTRQQARKATRTSKKGR